MMVGLLAAALVGPGAVHVGLGPRWSSFYGVNASLQHGWVNLAIIDGGTDSFHQQRQLESYERYQIPALLPMPEHGVFRRRNGSVPSGLVAGWEGTLEKWATEFALPRMRNGSVIGSFVGDEICCHNSSCWEDQLVPITSKLRQFLGPNALLYENDCTDSIEGANDSFHCQEPRGCPPIRHIAPALDYVSADYYTGYGPANIHGENGTAEADGVRNFYESIVYPKLGPHQNVWVVPGVFACSNVSYMPLANSSRSVIAKLSKYFEWAKVDPRVAGVNPWHLSRRSHSQHPTPCDMMLGAVDMPDVMKLLRSMGEWIEAHQPPPALKVDDSDTRQSPRVTVWWKPESPVCGPCLHNLPNVSMLREEADEMARHGVTDVILYCQFYLNSNSDVVVNTSHAGGGFHGLCSTAASIATAAGMSVQLLLQNDESSHATRNTSIVLAALHRPREIAAQLLRLSAELDASIAGWNFDFEPWPHSHDPSQGTLYAQFLRAVKSTLSADGHPATVTVCANNWTSMFKNYSELASAVDTVFDMSTYHAINQSDFARTLDKSTSQLAPHELPKLATGLAMYNRFPFEVPPASVGQRF
eukprot:SAG22_NODE_2340_length_2689_cov_1.976448_2_plen_585_part_01